MNYGGDTMQCEVIKMKTKIEGNKIVYQFDIQKADAYGLFLFGKYGKFQTPDSDGNKLEKTIKDIKDKERVSVTVTVDRPQTNTELLREELEKELPRYEIGKHEIDGIDICANTFYTSDLNKLRKLQEKHNAMLWCNVTGDKVRFHFHSIHGVK